jgi:MFS transporter, DHA1 family, multidrug resistance protein
MSTQLKNKFALTVILLMVYPLMGVGIDLYTPSMPAILKYFGTDKSMVKLSVGIYLFGGLTGSLILGTLSDHIGKKKSFLISLAIFALGSFFIAISPDINTFLINRFIEGLGAGGFAAVVKAIMIDNYKGKDLSKITVYASIAFGLGPTIAPALGGYIEHYINWKASFVFLLLYSSIIFIMTIFLLHNDTPKHNVKLNINNTLRVYLKILSNKIFFFVTLTLLISYSIRVIFNVIGPFLIQDKLGYSPVAFGNIALLLGLAALIGSIVNRYLISFLTLKQIIFSGVIIGLLGSLTLLSLGLFHFLNIYVIVIPIAVILFGENLYWPHYMAKSLSAVPEYTGAASALSSVMLAIGISSSSTITSFFNSNSQIPCAVIFTILSIIIFSCFFIIFSSKMIKKYKNH